MSAQSHAGAPAAEPRSGSGPRLRIPLPRSFHVLANRNFRLLWTGNLISNTGDWMDQISFNWLVYSLTDSAIWLALVNACRFIPIIAFTLLGGVVADRFERRRLMFLTQSAALLLAILLAVLVATGAVQIWMVMAIACGRGVMNSFNVPAKQSLISELVPPDELRDAISLNAAQQNLTRIIGPAIGGLLIATVGVVGAFYLNGVSFLAVLWNLAQMRFTDQTVPRASSSMIAEMAEGVRYLQCTPPLGMLVLLALIPVVLGNPYVTMLTVFASDVLQVGGIGLGLLTACSSVGAVAGALAVGILRTQRRGPIMLGSLLGFGGSLILFAFSRWLALSVGALFVAGLTQQLYLTLNNSVIQEQADPAYRGRVLSMLFLNRGALPLGTMLAGLLTASFGAQWGIGALAAVLVVLALGVSRFVPALRHLV